MSGQYEQIQALVLKTLDTEGTIPDSRELNAQSTNVDLSTPDAQTALKAVLDSLLSKEVSRAGTRDAQRLRADDVDDRVQADHDDIVYSDGGGSWYRPEWFARV